MIRTLSTLAILGLTAVAAPGQSSQAFGPQVREFITEDAPVIALTHVRVIDGTGAAPREDQTLIISNGKIAAISSDGFRAHSGWSESARPLRLHRDARLDRHARPSLLHG